MSDKSCPSILHGDPLQHVLDYLDVRSLCTALQVGKCADLCVLFSCSLHTQVSKLLGQAMLTLSVLLVTQGASQVCKEWFAAGLRRLLTGSQLRSPFAEAPCETLIPSEHRLSRRPLAQTCSTEVACAHAATFAFLRKLQSRCMQALQRMLIYRPPAGPCFV